MLNFNVDPYFDDFDPSKNYHRILFKPGRAVQARELTQSQTILQNQISKFADHIFTQNTPIKGGKVTVNLEAESLKLNPVYNDSDIVASDFLNQVVTDDTGTVLAKVIAAEESTSTDAPTLILTYFSGSTFSNGANVISTTSGLAAQAASADALGTASVASVSNGVFYIINGYNYSSTQNEDGTYSRYSTGHFVEVQPQTIILEKYNNTPNARIGLDISEYVSDYVTDPSLLDPAVGATNYQAPGADRYTIDLNLTAKSLVSNGQNDENFIELTRVQDGKIVRQFNDTTYSAIDDYFAKRTYETNGDYIVSQFKLSPRANTAVGGSDKYLLDVGAGTAYIQGYRNENQGQLTIDGNRARQTSSINNNVISPGYGNYFYVNSLAGANGSVFDTTTMQAVDFHISSVGDANTRTSNTYNSTVAASGYIRNLTYVSSGTNSNTQSYIYKTYVYGLSNKVISSNVASATSNTIAFFDNTTKFSIKNNIYNGVILTIDSGTGIGQSRKILSYNGATKTATLETPFNVIPTSSSKVSLRFAVKDIESVVRAGTGTSSNLAIYASAAIDNQSKVNQFSTGDTVLFDTGEPELIFQLGNSYVSDVTDASYTSLQTYRGQIFGVGGGGVQRAVTIDPSATSIFNFIRTGAEESADSIKQNFIVMVTDPGTNINIAAGEIISFTNSPTRTVTVNSNKTTATFFAADLAPFTASIFCKINVINADSTSFVLKQKTLVQANTTTIGTSGSSGIVDGAFIDLNKAQIYIDDESKIKGYGTPQNLYVSDVKRILKIIDTNALEPSLTMLTDPAYDVTANYTFDNGQRDGYYGHATISLRAGAPKPKRLWIFFDYYETTGGDGYYDKNSYINENYIDIPSYTSSNGTRYNLRDSIDFRPIVLNAQPNFVFRYSVTPTSSNFYGSLIPQDQTSFTSDYSYYLGRKDLLVLNKDSGFEIVQGVPSVNPQLPATPSSGLVVANITHQPYTAVIPGEVSGQIPSMSIEPIQHKNWQMKDISKMQERINYIQYYSALNLLEQSTNSLQIPDTLGLNRFKNGILVDDFSTFAVADSFNSSYSASIDTRKSMMTAALDIQNYQLQNLTLLDSINYGSLSASTQTSLGFKLNQYGRTSVITRPFTEEPLVVQKLASIDVDVNAFSVRNSQGTLELTPPMDNWIDTTKEPSLLFIDPTLRTFRATNNNNLLQIGDWQAIPGTTESKTVVNYTTSKEFNWFGGDDTWSDIRTATGETTTTTQDFTRDFYYGNYSESKGIKANYVTDVSLIPYIRSQQIQFTGKGMLINTNVNAFFDKRRVSRLIKKPNIIELSVAAGTNFRPGDTVGYISGGSFVKTGKVLDVYNSSSTATRLYVYDDNVTATYGTTLVAGTFNQFGAFVGTTASGTILSTKHYSGILGITASATSTVTLNSKASSVNNFYVGMEFNIVGGSATGVSSIPKGSSVKIGSYNGSTKVASLVDINGNPTTVSFISGDVYSIGPLQTNEIGNVSGIFYVLGGYFPTGERIFRLDNRVVTQTATEFVFQSDTASTIAEATFIASGLSKKTQEAEYSPSFAAASQVTTVKQYDFDRVIYNAYAAYVPAGGGGGGCCVVATQLEKTGEWDSTRKNTLEKWCEAKLHDTMLGECFRRGYQVICSKVAVPIMRGESKLSKYLSKYYVWSWNNGTNMVMGKKFNPISIPNSILWITGFMTVGAIASKEYAQKSWKNLYK
jgi:hypothetical protein